ncbi:MAG: DUF11 domain-containing protein [Anaerolineae bacterium]|nr:DUF11 domain-containing protein [Anaerolineae bacterium]
MKSTNSWRSWYKIGVAVIALITILFSGLAGPVPVHAQGTLTVDIIAGYNLVVDSNVSSPSTYAPRVATVIGKFCNTSTTADLTNVYGYIGNGTTAGTYTFAVGDSDTGAADFGTGGIWNYLRNTGDYYYRHVGSTADATRYMGTIPAGECRYQYWTIEYPACENVGGAWQEPPCTADPLWGPSVKPDDDFSLPFTIWGTADGPATATKTWTMTMRNEISAMANKIEPNPLGRWFNTEDDTVNVGDVVTTTGVLYSLGNVRFGFDNDENYVPDYNAWLQPISQADFDPGCFRLIGVTGVLTVTRGGGTQEIIPIDNSLYFTDLPDDNTNVLGEVYYTFLALDGPCSVGLTPYQEAASGFDNEKFNGDYGTSVPTVQSLAPEVTIDKSSDPDTIAAGGTTTFTISFANAGTTPVGLSLSSSGINMPLVISDTIPEGMEYVAGSADYNISNGITATVRYYNGTTWVTTEPTPASNVAALQWWLSAPLPAGGSGSVWFEAGVPTGYTGDAILINDACIGLGDADPFACDDAPIKVTGSNTITGTVFEDDGDGNNFANELYDTDEAPIPGITVTLYISTTHGWVMWDEMVSNATTGEYSFTNLPDGEYRVDVGSVQDSHPGWTNTTDTSLYVDLDSGHVTTDPVTSPDNDFGFVPALTLDKALIGPSPALEDQLVSYTIDLNNILPGDGTATPQYCQYTVWGSGYDANYTTIGGNKEWYPYQNALGADGPDGAYASSEFANTQEEIGVTNFALGTQLGSLGQVDVLMAIEIVDPSGSTFRSTDQLDVYVIDTQGTAATTDDVTVHTQTYTGVTLNTYAENTPFVLEISNIATSTLTLSAFNGSRYVVELVAGGAGGQYYNYIALDAVGFRITTDQLCGGDAPNTTIDPLPLTDTYDAAKLEFYSAEPVQSSVTTGGSTPYANTGTIYWNNLGPLYAGGTEIVTVTFRARDGIALTTITNTATVDNAYFTNGIPANDATDSVTNTVTQTARLGDWVWNDTDGDGVQDTGEVGIAGVVITLTADVTITVDGVDYPPGTEITTTTDADGYYLFTGLLDGTYTVSVDTSTLPGSTFTPTVDFDGGGADNSVSVVVDGGTVDSIGGVPCTANCELDVDFGYQVPNTIMGSVWHDHDGLADRDPGDEGFGGVTVWLYDSGNNLIATTTTNPDGSYIFSDLGDGSYYIVVDPSTLPYASSITWDQTVDPGGIPDDNTSGTYTLSGGTLVTDVDFAYHQEGDYTLGGTVYADWNVNADLDTGEPGFAGITVTLYSSTGAIVATTTTDAYGVYTFTDLITDTYTVVVDRSGIPAQYGETEDYDERPYACATCDNQAASVTVNATYSSVTDVDFGYAPSGTGAIGDTVWRDMNGDGTQAGPQETGIAGVTVTLQIDLNGDGNWVTVETAVTGADGKYLFDNLPDGSYRVIVDTAAENIPEGPGGFTYVPSTPTTQSATISGGSTDLDRDFGFTPLAAIGDRVWLDTNGNGNQDEDEPGISGVTLRLYTWDDTNDNGYYDSGDVITATATTDTTDSDGFYLFSGLAAGSYVVMVESGVPTTYTQSGDPDWLEPCTGTGLCDGASGVNLRTGQVDLSRDFGYQPPAVIGDYVWFDNNGDGVQDDDEGGIAYVTMYLDWWNGSAWVQTESTVTDSDGYYYFGDLGAGSYRVRVDTATLPAGLTATYDRDDGTTSPDSVVTDIVIDSTGAVTEVNSVACTGDCNLEMDFGYRYYDQNGYSISGHVFFDAGSTVDGTGDTYNSGADTPYEGIPIYLWRDGQIVGETTTDSTGYYSFGNLPDGGTYTVSVDRRGRLDRMALTATPNNTPEVQSFNTVTINGADVTDQDFGFYEEIDYDDLPDDYDNDYFYDTLVASAGAGHILGDLWLGAAVDSEADGSPTTDASGDGYDDGIEFSAANWAAGTSVNITATVTGDNGYLVGWFDWNGDGSFGAGEMIVFGDLISATHLLTVEIPSAANPGYNIYMRFRLYDRTTMTYISPTGLAENGEVEGYRRDFYPTAVALSRFWSTLGSGSIILHWETATELDNLGFYLERAESPAGPRTRLHADLILSYAPGSPVGATYEFVDNAVAPGATYYYWLIAVDTQMRTATYGPLSQRLGTGGYLFFLPLVNR